MPDKIQAAPQHQAPPRVPHHLADQGAALLGVAVDRAVLAGRFRVERALAAFQFRVGEELGASRTELPLGGRVFATAVGPDEGAQHLDIIFLFLLLLEFVHVRIVANKHSRRYDESQGTPDRSQCAWLKAEAFIPAATYLTKIDFNQKY